MSARAYRVSFNRFELRLRKEDALSGSHQGACDADIAELRTLPRIAKQLDKLGQDKIAREVAEWSDWDTSDHEQNRARLLWIACGNLKEEKGW